MNHTVFLWINDWRSPALDWLMNAVSLSGSMLNIVWLAPLGLWLLLRGSSSRNHAGKQCTANLPIMAQILVWILGFALAISVVAALKFSLQLPRPDVVFGSHVMHSFMAQDSRYTFPSGHATFAMWLAVSLWQRVPAVARACLVVYVIAVGLSRINLGMHFPTDVLTGYAIGGLSAWLSTHAYLRLSRWHARRLSPSN